MIIIKNLSQFFARMGCAKSPIKSSPGDIATATYNKSNAAVGVSLALSWSLLKDPNHLIFSILKRCFNKNPNQVAPLSSLTIL